MLQIHPGPALIHPPAQAQPACPEPKSQWGGVCVCGVWQRGERREDFPDSVCSPKVPFPKLQGRYGVCQCRRHAAEKMDRHPEWLRIGRHRV